MADTFIFQHTDFVNQTCGPSILARHIREAGYAVALLGITKAPAVPGFTITIRFAADLQPAEVTDLNALVAAHDPNDPTQIPPSGAPRAELAPEDFDAWGDDVRDDGAAIQAAMDAAAAMGGGVVTLRPGATYRTGAGLVIPTRVVLRIPNLARLRVMANVDALTLQAGAVLDHRGQIDVQTPAYTASAIVLDGAQRFNLGDGTAILGGGLVVGKTSSPPPTGTGLYLHAHTVANDHVSWLDVDLSISGFQYGVHCHAEVPAPSGGTYIAANTFSLRIANCVQFIRLEGGGRGSNNAITGNRFRGALQTHVGQPYAERAIYCETWLNEFVLYPFDWGSANVASLKSIELTKTSGNNRIVANVIPSAVIDETAGGENQNRFETLSEYLPQLRGMAAPPAIDQPIFLGDQNDMLAAGDLYTVTPSVAPSTGAMSDLFSTTPNTGPRWNAPAGEVAIEIDFGGTVGGFYAAGVNFGLGLIPRSVDIEYENGGQWVSIYSTTTNARRDIFAYFGAAGVNGTTRLRLRIADPDASDLWVTRLFAFSSSRPGRAFVRQERVLWVTSAANYDPGTIQPGDTAVIDLPHARAETIDAAGPAIVPPGFSLDLIAMATVNFTGNVQIRLRNTGAVAVAAPVGQYGAPVFKR